MECCSSGPNVRIFYVWNRMLQTTSAGAGVVHLFRSTTDLQQAVLHLLSLLSSASEKKTFLYTHTYSTPLLQKIFLAPARLLHCRIRFWLERVHSHSKHSTFNSFPSFSGSFHLHSLSFQLQLLNLTSFWFFSSALLNEKCSFFLSLIICKNLIILSVCWGS